MYKRFLFHQNHSFLGPMVRIPPFQGGGPCSVRNFLVVQYYRILTVKKLDSRRLQTIFIRYLFFWLSFVFLLAPFWSCSVIERKKSGIYGFGGARLIAQASGNIPLECALVQSIIVHLFTD